MFFFLHSTDVTIGSVDKAVLDSLPVALKGDFLETVTVTHSEDGRVEFRLSPDPGGERLIERLRNYEKNKARYRARSWALNSLSAGRYEKADIDEIFEAQKGKCYYTGAPLARIPKNYAIDHIVPVCKGGSCWPRNLALCLVEVNRQKGDQSKKTFLTQLRASKGSAWFAEQQSFMKKVDSARLQIDRRRRKVISAEMREMSHQLRARFEGIDVDFVLEGGEVELRIGSSALSFSPGFIRRKRQFASEKYLAQIIEAVLG